MKYFSMFSGIGGFELGILYSQQTYAEKHENKEKKLARRREIDNEDLPEPNSGSRLSCIGYSEIDKYAFQIHQKHFPAYKGYGDATTINSKELPDFDLLCGGFPCQSFSIAGKRQGFNDTRGTMFFEIARIIREKQPRLLLLENVKGLLSHDKGRTFATILSTLDELGYDVQWQVLNSKNFSVPQNRERVFIIGHLRGTSRPEVFPIGGNDGKPCKIFGRIKAINGHDYLKRCYSIEGACPTLPTGTGGNHEAKIAIPVLTPNRKEKRQNGRRMKKDGEPSFTLTAQDRHGVYDGYKIRRLTPTECERLQGFPDGWTEGISDTQRYKCLGNAVTVNVIQAIMEKLQKATK